MHSHSSMFRSFKYGKHPQSMVNTNFCIHYLLYGKTSFKGKNVRKARLKCQKIKHEYVFITHAFIYNVRKMQILRFYGCRHIHVMQLWETRHMHVILLTRSLLIFCRLKDKITFILIQPFTSNLDPFI